MLPRGTSRTEYSDVADPPILSTMRWAPVSIELIAGLLLWVPLGAPPIGAFADSLEYIILAQPLRTLSTGDDITLPMNTETNR